MGRFNSGVVADDMARFFVASGRQTSDQAVQAMQDIVHAMAQFSPDHKVGGLSESLAVDKADRKSTRLNSSHSQMSYAVFCLNSLNHAANFVRQIRRCRRAIEQNPARIAQQCVSPGKNNNAADNPDYWIKPAPTKKFAAS